MAVEQIVYSQEEWALPFFFMLRTVLKCWNLKHLFKLKLKSFS